MAHQPRCARSWMCLAGWMTVSFLLAAAGVPEARGGMAEAELTAAYLYNFSKFVRWPAVVFPDADAPLVLCVYGQSAPSEAMVALNGKTAQGHALRVVRRARGERLADCHIAYIHDSEEPYLAPLLRSLDGKAVLTVSDLPGFATAGGMIGFVMLDDRLRFEINRSSAESAGLIISSQLLKLATRVVRD